MEWLRWTFGAVRYAGMILGGGGGRAVKRLCVDFAFGVAFELLDFEFGLGEFGLAMTRQATPLLEPRDQCFECEVAGFHFLDQGLEFLDRVLVGEVCAGIETGLRIPGRLGHARKARRGWAARPARNRG